MSAVPEVRGHWLWGSLRELSAAPHRFPAEAARAHGGLARFRVLHKSMVAVAHPDYVRHILVTRAENYRKSYHYRRHALLIGEGLITSDGSFWQAQRRKVQPAFNQPAIERMVDATAVATNEMLSSWEKQRARGEAVDVVRFTRSLTLRVIAHALLGRGLMDDPALVALGDAILAGMAAIRRRNTRLVVLPLAFPSPDNCRLKAARRRLDAFIGEEIARRSGAPADGPITDMLEVLRRARDQETGETMATPALLDETKTLFAAGYETTASALAWTLYLLAKHGEAANRWHAEIRAVLEGRQPGVADLAKLTYSQQVVQEAMRLYPPVYSLGRESIEPDEIGGCSIPARQTLLISIYGLHRDPAWWPEPEAFRPERFAPEANWPRNAYLPFGAGRRACVGNHFAMTEMLVALAILGQRYRLERVAGPPVEVSAQVTLAPGTPIRLRLNLHAG